MIALDAVLSNADWSKRTPDTIDYLSGVSAKSKADRAVENSLNVGSWVTLPDGRVGRVDHVMTEGELNLGDVAMPATPDAPVALVSVWEGESFGEPVPVAVSELQAAEEPEAARAYGKPKRKPRKRKEK